MKRTALIAIVIAIMTFGTVGLAVATDPNVTVNATVNPAFSFTLEGPANIDLEANPLTYPVDTGNSSMRVKSNVPWTFTADAPAYSNALFGDFMTDTVSIPNGSKGRGVTPISTSYTLDLSDDDAYDLAPGTYTATYVYTAVQD